MKQIIIISEDRPGVVAEISEAMAAAGVNIETISAETVAGSGVTILTVDKYDEALKYYQESLEIKKSIGDQRGVSATLSNMAIVFQVRGDYERSVRTYEEALAISEEMDAVVGGADVARGKPAPDTFLLAAERCGVPPERCLVIEDAPAGLAAARAAGMRCIGVTGTKPREALSDADLVVDSLTEVGVEVIERLLQSVQTSEVFYACS